MTPMAVETDLLPLLSPAAAPFAVYRGQPIAAEAFVATAEAFAASLPESEYLVNLCENRYHFALAWVAACLRSRITLLPPTRARGVLSDLASAYPSQHTIDDELVQTFLERSKSGEMSIPAHWQVPRRRVVALTFTSGSTGIPQPHPKEWGTLSRNAQLACAEVLGGPGAQLVATVPAQHAYGLETSLISALSAGCTIFDGKPFFPQDVRSALMSLSGPRTLVTTPMHLKAVLDANVQLPALRRVISATAPLSRELAQRVEAAWATEVFEIYGCTEAGIMARRRTTLDESWQAFPGGVVVRGSAGHEYRAPQQPQPIPLQDVIESIDDARFHLRGRAADMIKVAGKRTSLQDITRQLLAVEGVEDAAVFVPEPDARPVAIVVAPNVSSQRILSALAERIEAVFLPRPLLQVERLPRNDVGKLPREALLDIWRRHKKP